jgi:predicted amidohydrolase
VAAGVPVVYANDNSGQWRSDFKFVVHGSLESTGPGADITRALEPAAQDYFVLKPKHSAFFATPFEILLDHLGTRRLIIAGVSGDQCAINTAADARMRDFEVAVPADCVASLTPARNQRAIEHLRDVLGIRPAGRPTCCSSERADGPPECRARTRPARSLRMTSTDFQRPISHGFVRVAVGVPRLRIADPDFNAQETIVLHERASKEGASLVVFPELGLAAYTCDDLFHQDALLSACEAALKRIVEASKRHSAMAIVGLPLRLDQGLYNCAALVRDGRLLGVVPKSYLPNYGEFYEALQFQPASHATATQIAIGGVVAPFGTNLLFQATNVPSFGLHAEICEDLWVPVPPSSLAALAGATVLANLSASNITIGKATTGASSSRRSRPGASRPTSTHPQATANRRPTWPGTASRSSARTA